MENFLNFCANCFINFFKIFQKSLFSTFVLNVPPNRNFGYAPVYSIYTVYLSTLNIYQYVIKLYIYVEIYFRRDLTTRTPYLSNTRTLSNTHRDLTSLDLATLTSRYITFSRYSRSPVQAWPRHQPLPFK